MDVELTAKRLASLGHRHRLELFMQLVRAGHGGMTIGELQVALESPPSTVAFHLRELVAAGMVTQTKEGRMVHCRANYAALNQMMQSVAHSCCADVSLSKLSIPKRA